jgi:hypothetical protein
VKTIEDSVEEDKGTRKENTEGCMKFLEGKSYDQAMGSAMSVVHQSRWIRRVA